jgi:hypothetical protein
MFPTPDPHSQSESRDREQRVISNPDVATVRKRFNDSRTRFEKSGLGVHLCQNLEFLSERKCDKIVAFGAGSLCSPYEPTHHISKTRLTQHAALLVARDTLIAKNIAVGKKIDIFVQDPSYTRLDHDVLKEYGVIIVDGSIGCQMGFVLINKEPLIIDFNMSPYLFPLFMEIDRPLAIFRGMPLDKERYEDAPIKDTTLHDDSRAVIVPASGT